MDNGNSYIVECVDLFDCNTDATRVCPQGFEMVAIAGRDYNPSAGSDRGAIKQMQVNCTDDAHRKEGKSRGPAPTGLAGFMFDSTLDDIGETCRGAGYEYRSEGKPRCSGLPTDLGLDAFATFEVCDDKVCVIEVGVRPGSVDDLSWFERFSGLRVKLTQKYGKPKSDAGEFEAACLYPDKCTKLATLRGSYSWAWESGETIELSVRSDLPRGPLIFLRYASPLKEKEHRADGL